MRGRGRPRFGRYFTLERARRKWDTALCEWSGDGAHLYHGHTPGPVPGVEGFIQMAEEKVPLKKGRVALDIRQPERGHVMDAMGSIRELMFAAKTTGRMDELLGEMAEARALELPDMQQGPPGRTLCFGSVVVDPARERVLLRRSANPDRNVFGWTFSKGQPPEVAPERAGFLRSEWLPEGGGCAGEAELPEKLILRIALRQLGGKDGILAPIPCWFVGERYAFRYWVAEALEEITQPDRPARRMSRGEVVQWFSWGEAEDAIQANASRGADLLVLEAARQVIKQISADGK